MHSQIILWPNSIIHPHFTDWSLERKYEVICLKSHANMWLDLNLGLSDSIAWIFSNAFRLWNTWMLNALEISLCLFALWHFNNLKNSGFVGIDRWFLGCIWKDSRPTWLKGPWLTFALLFSFSQSWKSTSAVKIL